MSVRLRRTKILKRLLYYLGPEWNNTNPRRIDFAEAICKTVDEFQSTFGKDINVNAVKTRLIRDYRLLQKKITDGLLSDNPLDKPFNL